MKQVYAAERFGGRLKRKGGQLVPLHKRMNARQAEKRAFKRIARSTVAEVLVKNQNALVNVIGNKFFARGFFGRMKFILFGR